MFANQVNAGKIFFKLAPKFELLPAVKYKMRNRMGKQYLFTAKAAKGFVLKTEESGCRRLPKQKM